MDIIEVLVLPSNPKPSICCNFRTTGAQTMAVGTLTSVAKSAVPGPRFHDRVTMAGTGTYAAGGNTGLLAALRALRGDQRFIVAVEDQSVGANYVVYTPTDDKLHVFVRTTGVELGNGTDSVVYTLSIESI